MNKELLSSELLKIKRKGFWLLTVLGPFGVVALQMMNYAYRKEYLLKQSTNDWEYYILNVSGFTPFALVLGMVILTSFLTSIENETNTWKKLISLPVSKASVYITKFTLLASLLFLSSVLLMLFTLLYGIFLDFNGEILHVTLFQYSFYPYFASLPVLALQLWISTVSKNQAVPITIGVIGVILVLTNSYSPFPDWIIWKWPSLMNQWDKPIINVVLGIIVGCLIYIVGMLDFIRRDVK
ncbi:MULTISPECIES: ABC transporter permease [Clostridia]|uniref:ABC transporter permease n=1 Tax=Clostridia TaxID=186801 RepID=UPI000EA263DF|nr:MULTISPECIES: ABC transporter permease [Clostridia]NBJ69201.1 permease [Roseburia sp. 1XD42-34]RKI79173.1 permease [Clostridium sp. 1xD42-85]